MQHRYLSPVEACWRIVGKELQGKSHSVEQLPVHLENEQVVVFNPQRRESAEKAVQKNSKLTAFFKYCQKHPDEKVKYPDMPKQHTWHDKEGEWKRREGRFKTLGRMHSINPSQSELFHLRLLLLHVECPTSFKDLKTVDGVTCESYAHACLERGLVKNDEEWYNCLEEAALYKFPSKLRLLFVTILTHCSPVQPEMLWEKFKNDLSEDFQRERSKEDAYRLAYISINRLLVVQGKRLADYPSMPPCNDDGSDNIEDILTKEDAAKFVDDAKRRMNRRQKKVFEKVEKMLKGNTDGKHCLYLNGAAGTGKSFVFRAIYHLALSMSKKVTSMAFMGIAATVLPKGRTVHNVFGLPFKVFADSQSTIDVRSKQADDLKQTDIFLWDEAPSAPRYALEIADRKLREIMQNDKPFGGKCVMLTGDFAQTLPIKEGGTRSEIVDLAICSSRKLWKHFAVYRLKKNMRAGPGEKEFAKELRKIGTASANDENEYVTLPASVVTRKSLAKKVFRKCFRNKDFDTVAQRAILAMLNSRVDEINDEVLGLLDGDIKEYTSIDEALENNNELATEVLNSFQAAGLPPHSLRLKVNSTIILMRNLNVQQGLCNGTRMRVTEMGHHVLRCIVVAGDQAGEEVYVPRITLNEQEKFPVAFRRHQFPVKLAMSMTVNRSQGQTLDMVGLDLTYQAFAHGQMYVALSRVRSWDRVKVQLPEEAQLTRKTANIVYSEVLRKAKVTTPNDSEDENDEGSANDE